MRAAIKFGGQVDSVARSYGIKGPHPGAILLKKLEKGESGGRGNAVSSAGARGWTQFMPATRAEYIHKYGIDPWHSESEALHATAIYLSHDGNGLKGYNPGDPGYTHYILSQHAAIKGGGASPSGGDGGSSSSATVTTPAKTKLNVTQAILDTLSQHPKNLAGTVLNKLAFAPQYTTHTAAKTTTTDSSPAASPSATGAPTAHGVDHLDGKPVAAWIANVLRQARAAGWTGTVSSGYRSVAEQAKLYADLKAGRRAGPVAKPGTSNHNFTAFPGGAVDVTNAAQLSRVLKKLGITKLQWAGQKDPVHFSHPHGGGY